MLDYGMLKYSYSMIAAAAVFTANKALARSPELPHSLRRHCGFAKEDLMPCAVCLTDLHRNASAGAGLPLLSPAVCYLQYLF